MKELRKMTPEFHMKLFGAFGANTRVDMEELVLMGHSFGGITAMMVAAMCADNEQPRACLTMDPWLFAHSDDFDSGKFSLKCPMQIVNSEDFHPAVYRDSKQLFDSWATILNSFKKHKDMRRTENVVVLKNTHNNQVDQSVLNAWEMCVIEGVYP